MSDGSLRARSHQHHLTEFTFGEMRASGVRDVPIYCRDHRCSRGEPFTTAGLARMIERVGVRQTKFEPCISEAEYPFSR